MTDEITPARLRELAGDLDRYFAGYTPQFAAALRAAAKQLESVTAEMCASAIIERNQARATLAAREALLKRAMNALNAPDATIPMRTRDGVEVDAPAYTPEEARDLRRALAAEIAAALEETDND